MNPTTARTGLRTIVVGAGMAGLTAAGLLHEAGDEVLVLDKGRAPGGRIATRRMGSARIDHGAQFFTVRSPIFAAQVADWQARGLAAPWPTPQPTPGTPHTDSYPRYIGTAGMTTIPKALAAGLDLRCEALVFTVRPSSNSGWEVTLDDGSRLACDRVIITSPLPQTASLLMEAEVELPEDLWRIDYHRTIGLLAQLASPSPLEAPGILSGEELEARSSILAFVADQVHKGVSPTPALLVHASHAWSLEAWDSDPAELEAGLRAEVTRVLPGTELADSQVKKWRLAVPARMWPAPFWARENLVLAGDAFDTGIGATTPNLEGAYLSGRAAARHLLGVTDHSDDALELE